MPKSRQNLSSLLSMVFYIFFDLFLVVHSREIAYFRKEKQFSTQNSVFLEQFYRMSGSRNTRYGKCRNDFDMIISLLVRERFRFMRKGFKFLKQVESKTSQFEIVVNSLAHFST